MWCVEFASLSECESHSNALLFCTYNYTPKASPQAKESLLFVLVDTVDKRLREVILFHFVYTTVQSSSFDFFAEGRFRRCTKMQ